MKQAVPVIKVTNDYSMFKILNGNRVIDRVHVLRLKASMNDEYLFTFIVVNEKNEIIDGQHRFTAIKELGFPLYYIVCPGYAVEQVYKFNTNTSNWTREKFLKSYAALGAPAYVKFKQFMDEYPELKFVSVLSLLGTRKTMRVNGLSVDSKSFEKGELEIRTYKEGVENAKRLYQLKDLFADWNSRSFVEAFLSVIKVNTFDFSDFIKKVKKYPTKMVHCATTTEFKELIEKVYNIGRTNKVSLKYAE